MKHELKHRSYRPTVGGQAVGIDKLINDLDNPEYYTGTYSVYNPIGINGRGDLAVHVHKQWTGSSNEQKPFRLEGFRLKSGMHLHSEDYNCNSSVGFSKQDLLRIANAMDDTDIFQVDYVGGRNGHINEAIFLASAEKVVG
jgi:hypothetical protein